MDFPDGSFDTAVLYNSFFHIRPAWDAICRECKRVLRENGVIYIAETWKLDANLMKEVFGDAAQRKGGFLIVRMTK